MDRPQAGGGKLKVIETFGRWRGRTRSEMTVRLVRSGELYEGKQGMSYRRGLTGDTVGSQAISVTVLVLPGGARGKTHLHHGIESAAYVLDGRFDCFYGPRLEDHIEIGAGDLVTSRRTSPTSC